MRRVCRLGSSPTSSGTLDRPMTQDVYMGRKARSPETAAALEEAWTDA